MYAYFDGENWIENVDARGIKNLASVGTIQPKTLIRMPNGKEVTADKITGLVFAEPVEVPVKTAESNPIEIPIISDTPKYSIPISRELFSKNILIALCVVILTALSIAFFLSKHNSVDQFEYCVVSPKDISFDIKMNVYASEGWELISARRAGASDKMSYECILKRKVPPKNRKQYLSNIEAYRNAEIDAFEIYRWSYNDLLSIAKLPQTEWETRIKQHNIDGQKKLDDFRSKHGNKDSIILDKSLDTHFSTYMLDEIQFSTVKDVERQKRISE